MSQKILFGYLEAQIGYFQHFEECSDKKLTLQTVTHYHNFTVSQM